MGTRLGLVACVALAVCMVADASAQEQKWVGSVQSQRFQGRRNRAIVRFEPTVRPAVPGYCAFSNAPACDAIGGCLDEVDGERATCIRSPGSLGYCGPSPIVRCGVDSDCGPPPRACVFSRPARLAADGFYRCVPRSLRCFGRRGEFHAVLSGAESGELTGEIDVPRGYCTLAGVVDTTAIGGYAVGDYDCDVDYGRFRLRRVR